VEMGFEDLVCVCLDFLLLLSSFLSSRPCIILCVFRK
jgi:hypothetical protein